MPAADQLAGQHAAADHVLVHVLYELIILQGVYIPITDQPILMLEGIFKCNWKTRLNPDALLVHLDDVGTFGYDWASFFLFFYFFF